MAEDPLDLASVRAFLAIPLFEIFRNELDDLLRLLCRQIPGVRWAESPQVHLTLHFFGTISARQIDSIDISMKKSATLFGPFNLRLAGVGGFPDLKKPNIVWLGIEEKTGSLLSFQRYLQDALRRSGFETEVRPFLPHVTIGRVIKKAGDLKPLIAGIPLGLPTPERTADHFVLYQSHCLPQGARYEILKNYPLSKEA